MAFITELDYLTLIKAEIREAVTGSNLQVQTNAELAAQAKIESYLNQRYDVGNIFNKTGNDRHPLIILYMIDIALYEMHSRINPRMIPDIRVKRYDDAIAWLKMVQSGGISPTGLPAKQDDEGNVASVSRYGSKPKFQHDW